VRIELLTIGDELLNGIIADTNAAWLALRLFEMGFEVQRCTTLPDEMSLLSREMRAIAERCDVCICTGGLGPTIDDLTVDALATAADVPLIFDERAWQCALELYGDRTPPESNRRQARIPEGGQALYSEVGTAPGISVRVGDCLFLAVPGVPREMRWHMERYIDPILREMTHTPLSSRTLVFAGIGESSLAERVSKITLPSTVRVSYRTHMPENHVRLRSTDADALDEAQALITAAVPKWFVGEGKTSLTEHLLEQIRHRKLTLGVAESCTGGLLGARITQVPGVSDVFRGSVVCYANSAKKMLLGVREETLAEHGAVSEETAREMARGALERLETDIAVSITGTAGPGGGTAEKPVGTVCMAWLGPNLNESRRFQLRGDRERIRAIAVGLAQDRLRRWLNEQ
jgi:nicotinamide-nucleotide amidase